MSKSVAAAASIRPSGVAASIRRVPKGRLVLLKHINFFGSSTNDAAQKPLFLLFLFSLIHKTAIIYLTFSILTIYAPPAWSHIKYALATATISALAAAGVQEAVDLTSSQP